MDAFATYSDYTALYDTSESEARIDALLAKASRDIRAELRNAGVEVDPSDADMMADLADVACAMVRRSVGAGDDETDDWLPYGASQYSWTGGPYTQSATLSNPYGDLFMTESERRKLGIGVAKAAVLSPYA